MASYWDHKKLYIDGYLIVDWDTVEKISLGMKVFFNDGNSAIYADSRVKIVTIEMASLSELNKR